MKYYTEKHNNFYDVKCDDGTFIRKVGTIEKPYHNRNLFVCTGWNSEILAQDGNYIFVDFEAAKQRIIDHFEVEWSLLNS